MTPHVIIIQSVVFGVYRLFYIPKLKVRYMIVLLSLFITAEMLLRCVSAAVQSQKELKKNQFSIVEECFVICLGFKRQGTLDRVPPSDKQRDVICFTRHSSCSDLMTRN